MTSCPYCGKKMNIDRELPKFTPREFMVFNLLLSNGREYTKRYDIVQVLKEENESLSGNNSSIRVLLHYISKKLEPYGMIITNQNRVGWRIEEL